MALSTISRSAVTIIGAGTQGRRLAFMWSSSGNDVHLVDGQPCQLQASLKAIDGFRSDQRNRTWGKIITHSPQDMGTALKNSWMALECVPEQLSLKREVMTVLDSLSPENTILASNSSSYTCSEIIRPLKLRNQQRLLSAHSYWPPETPQLEVMGHEMTDPACIELLMKRSKIHGFSPFHVKKPSMGYIYNRIWAAIKREALLTASEGVATPEDIDDIFRGVLKTPKGPFELMDVVGLDVVMNIEDHYAEARADVPVKPREYLKGFIAEGNLGVKTGRGFYDYSK